MKSTIIITCMVFSFIWLLASFFVDNNNVKEHCLTRSAIFMAAVFIIVALND